MLVNTSPVYLKLNTYHDVRRPEKKQYTEHLLKNFQDFYTYLTANAEREVTEDKTHILKKIIKFIYEQFLQIFIQYVAICSAHT